MSASKFRDVTNNGTVNSSDDFKKKKPTTVFSCPTSQNKVYCGVGEAFFKERKGGLKGYFHLPFLPI